MVSSLYFVTSSLSTEEPLTTAVEGTFVTRYPCELIPHSTLFQKRCRKCKMCGVVVELSTQRGPSGLNKPSGLNAYLPHGLSLRLRGIDPQRRSQGAPRRSFVAYVQGVLLPMLRAYPWGPHQPMLTPGQAGVLGLWLQGLERQWKPAGQHLACARPEAVCGRLGSLSV